MERSACIVAKLVSARKQRHLSDFHQPVSHNTGGAGFRTGALGKNSLVISAIDLAKQVYLTYNVLMQVWRQLLTRLTHRNVRAINMILLLLR